MSSAKLDAAGHRWLAALGTYDFKLICRSGKANGDADGLSRRPYENTEIFSDVVKAICQAYTLKRDSCPYAETLEITCAPQLAHVDTQTDIQIQSSELQDVDWVKEQAADVTLNRIIYSLASSVLFRNTVLDVQQTRQLVLPKHFKDIVLKHLHVNFGHQGRDRTLSLVRARFYWPGLEPDV